MHDVDRRCLRRPCPLSDDRRSVIQVQRPVIMSGIEEFVNAAIWPIAVFSSSFPRSMMPAPPPGGTNSGRRLIAISRRFWAACSTPSPAAWRAAVDQRLRAAADGDFAAFGEAVGRALGWPAGKLLAKYNANRREATTSQIEDSLVATALLKFAESARIWTGTASELLSLLAVASSRKVTASAGWPKSAGRFANELRRLAPQLRLHGLTITFKRERERRLITLVFIVQ